MQRCIFCGRTEEEFEKDNKWSEEHIIPKSLGNERFVIHNVCKYCNSGLGAYVDDYVVNNRIIQIIRQTLGLKGQSGKIPNAFSKGFDSNGKEIKVSSDFKLSKSPSIEYSDGKYRVEAATIDEAKAILKKKMLRQGFDEGSIQNFLKDCSISQTTIENPTVEFPFEIDINRFHLEAVKIAYEYALYKLGEIYMDDQRAIQIKELLFAAINGEMINKCDDIPFVAEPPREILDSLSKIEGSTYHLLMLFSDRENNLHACISLFMKFSFIVLISQNASKYNFMNPIEVICVQKKDEN